MDYEIHECMFVKDVDASNEICDRQGKVFLIVDATFPDAGRASSVASGRRVKGSKTINNLPAHIESFIITNMKDLLTKGTERCVMVIDLGQFPYITALVDCREPEIQFGDKFEHDVLNAWKTYDSTLVIPVIMVNTELSYAGLKIIQLP
jgi:hypothetical protein